MRPRINRLADGISIANRLRENALAEVDSIKEKLTEATDSHAQWEEARQLIQKAAAEVQECVHASVADVVTRCLAAVCEDPYTFHIDFERKRGKTEARLYFKREGHDVDPLEAAGIGIVDVASFALRLAAINLHQPPIARVMLLDEPFRCLDKAKKVRMRELLLTLARDMDFQFVIISHDKEFQVGKVIEVK